MNIINKHSNWTVLSQSLHSKTQSWTLLLTVMAVLRDVLLSLPSCPLCCCLCPIMFVPCFVLLPCCVATMLCCHLFLPCYVVLGLALLCCVVSLVMCFVLYLYSIYFFIPGPAPRRRGLLPLGRSSL